MLMVKDAVETKATPKVNEMEKMLEMLKMDEGRDAVRAGLKALDKSIAELTEVRKFEHYEYNKALCKNFAPSIEVWIPLCMNDRSPIFNATDPLCQGWDECEPLGEKNAEETELMEFAEKAAQGIYEQTLKLAAERRMEGYVPIEEMYGSAEKAVVNALHTLWKIAVGTLVEMTGGEQPPPIDEEATFCLQEIHKTEAKAAETKELIEGWEMDMMATKKQNATSVKMNATATPEQQEQFAELIEGAEMKVKMLKKKIMMKTMESGAIGEYYAKILDRCWPIHKQGFQQVALQYTGPIALKPAAKEVKAWYKARQCCASNTEECMLKMGVTGPGKYMLVTSEEEEEMMAKKKAPF